MANITVGKIKCPMMGDYAEVRKNSRGKLYYYGKAGMITPNREDGQAWINDNAEFFSAAEIKEINEDTLAYGRRFNEEVAFQAPPKQEGGACLIQ